MFPKLNAEKWLRAKKGLQFLTLLVAGLAFVLVVCVGERERERELEGKKERERERRERKIDFCLRPAGLEMKVFFRVFDYGDVFLAYKSIAVCMYCFLSYMNAYICIY